jgi:hypothetical protein
MKIFLSILGGLLVVALGVFAFLSGGGADSLFASAQTGIAHVQVRIHLKDVNAKIENMVFHPYPGEGRHGLSYVCGYVRPSYEPYGSPRRFVYKASSEDVAIAGIDRRLDASIDGLCNRAPLPVGAFNFEETRVSMRQ